MRNDSRVSRTARNFFLDLSPKVRRWPSDRLDDAIVSLASWIRKGIGRDGPGSAGRATPESLRARRALLGLSSARLCSGCRCSSSAELEVTDPTTADGTVVCTVVGADHRTRPLLSRGPQGADSCHDPDAQDPVRPRAETRHVNSLHSGTKLPSLGH